MKILLDDVTGVPSFFPLDQLRSIVHLPLGILSIFEKWNHFFSGNVEVLSEISDSEFEETKYWIFPATIVPSRAFLSALKTSSFKISFTHDCKELHFPWHFFQYNDWAIREDFETLTEGKISEKLTPDNKAIGEENIFIESGADIRFSILNAETGPIYIAKNAQIMEGSLLRGPLYIGEGAIVKMGTKIYGASSIGASCIVGGEIKNSTLFGYSNKAHDGYLGDAVIGYWCNLGAGTSNSNLKNNASTVKVWDKEKHQFQEAGNKCGLIMGDYSRSAINTSFDTGSVVGVCCNIFDRNPSKFTDSFAWGNENYEWEKVVRDISNWKKLKGKSLEQEEIERIQKLYAKK